MQQTDTEIDVCLVVEGAYPFVAGGVSSWLDWLIRNQPELRFAVVAIVADDSPREQTMTLPENVLHFSTVALCPSRAGKSRHLPRETGEWFGARLEKVLAEGDLPAFADLVAFAQTPQPRGPLRKHRRPSRSDLLDSTASWDAMLRIYEHQAPQSSFVDFFWAWRFLMGGFFAVLTADLPKAACYHAISTGFAGLLAAAAGLAHARPALITEHGIYTNERRIDLTMADWVSDTIDKGPSGIDTRKDVRDFWIESFEAFARVSYATARRITTLYRDNQTFQRAIGAEAEKLVVIPNGIELENFADVAPDSAARRPTVALIGRVVPIKDIDTMVVAAAAIRRKVPDVHVLIMGPTDEDPEYFTTCQERVRALGLCDTVTFTGGVNIFDYLPQIDVLTLTSISEAQPLVLLEGGAAGIPCVATDVGSCREIIEGAPDEAPPLGAAGFVVPPMSPQAVSDAVVRLLLDADLRHACGAALKRRVESRFSSASSSERYRALYREAMVA